MEQLLLEASLPVYSTPAPSEVIQSKQNLMEFTTRLLPGHTHSVSPPLRHEHTRSQSPSSGCWYGGVTCKFTCHLTLVTLQTSARTMENG